LVLLVFFVDIIFHLKSSSAFICGE
jgi:hypothetical protein